MDGDLGGDGGHSRRCIVFVYGDLEGGEGDLNGRREERARRLSHGRRRRECRVDPKANTCGRMGEQGAVQPRSHHQVTGEFSDCLVIWWHPGWQFDRFMSCFWGIFLKHFVSVGGTKLWQVCSKWWVHFLSDCGSYRICLFQNSIQGRFLN